MAERRSYMVYKFNELSEEVKEKAKELYYEKEEYHFLEEDLKEELRTLDTLGIFSEIRLSFSLSCCQGDGLSFKASIDLEKYLKHKKMSAKKIERITDAVCGFESEGNTGRYCYASDSDIVFSYQLDVTDKEDIEIEAIRKEIASHYLDICKKLERSGYSILEYRMTDEEFAEFCDSNEYMFTEEGRID